VRIRVDFKFQIANIKLQIERGECMTSDELSERLLEFAARIGTLVDALPDTRLGRHIAGQLIRSGTSAAPNYEESRADFIHKLTISLKELRESRFWMRLIIKSNLLPKQKMGMIVDECEQLMKVIAKSVVTAKQKSRFKKTGKSQ
jgi:four helix bundle protein